jgi:murein DD-endopeptidase MepM/ murein hydrolase activator NlpD
MPKTIFESGKEGLRRLSGTIISLLILLLAACTPQAPAITVTVRPSETPNPAIKASATTAPTPTQSPTLPPPTPTAGPLVCSLLEGVAITELADWIANPFAPPRQGSDDPHQGIDFAEIDPAYQIAVEGRQVNAALGGVVAGVIEDRFPYGNAVLVETPLELLPDEWVEAIQIPTPAPSRTGHPSLTCPEGESPPNWDQSQRSLYLIYAHLKDPPAFQVGEMVACGGALNVIGSSGNSLNPHVHLEMRVGPAGASFESMAHYTGSASPQEMHNYCLWRVSETFQLLDPMQIFASGSQ